jgi:hypothetical protein
VPFWGRKLRAAVLGCGPAGLFATHALTQAGINTMVYSVRRKSEVFGAQSLHKNIPGLTETRPDFTIKYTMSGTVEQYLSKVYGPELPDGVDAETYVFGGEFPLWDIRAAYTKAWALYFDSIVDTKLDAELINRVAEAYDIVYSTIPAVTLCSKPKEHSFLVQDVWAVGDAPERGVFAPMRWPLNEIHYEAETAPSWYRIANINGYVTIEWPESVRPPVEDVARVSKPIRTNCDCMPGIKRVGRYGAWDRHQKAHDAYWTVREEMK